MSKHIYCKGGLKDRLERPVLFDRLDRPLELLAKCLGEEFLDGDVEFLAEHDGETRVDVVLEKS